MKSNMINKISKSLIKIKRSYAFTKRFAIDLSLSENPLGCSPKVSAIIKREINKISHYPDPDCWELKKALSKKFYLPMGKIIVSNGSEQLINLIPRVLLKPGDEAIIPEVTFPSFEIGVIIAGGRPIFSKMTRDFSIDLQDIKNKITKKTKLIFLCNPNNPTGKILDKKAILKLVKEVQPINVIVDEANIEFGGKSVVKEVNKLDNLIVLRTFSKAFGLAGLRIGIGFVLKELIEILNKIREPFTVNALAQNCAIFALRDEKFIKRSKKFMDEQREFLTKELRKREFEVIDSQSNNILIRVDELFESSTNFVKLLNQNNVSVVNGSKFRGLGNKFVRISPRLPKTNRIFLKVIDKLISNIK
jgi:histidinol-phosphate aminotransferase